MGVLGTLDVAELVLIQLTGADKPGLTSRISGLLAHYQVAILDIGQASIHDSLTLGILASIPSNAESGLVL